jgi:hypothetical protein
MPRNRVTRVDGECAEQHYVAGTPRGRPFGEVKEHTVGRYFNPTLYKLQMQKKPGEARNGLQRTGPGVSRGTVILTRNIDEKGHPEISVRVRYKSSQEQGP